MANVIRNAGTAAPLACAVIVLNYNGKDLLARCLESLRRQSARDLTIVVIDNGSDDDSAAFVRREFPEVTLVALPENLGFCGGNNVGIQHALRAGFHYVLLLNNDTVCAPDCLERLLDAACHQPPNVAAWNPKIYFADTARLWFAGGEFSLWTARARHRGWKTEDRGQFDIPADMTLATGCALLLRCSALREIGLLDERFFAYLEDVEWSVRARRAGYRLRFVPQAVLWHDCGGTSVGMLGRRSQWFPQRLSSRNLALLARKHLRPWHWPTFLLGACWFYLLFYSCLRLWRRDLRAFAAIYAGLWEGLRASSSADPYVPTSLHSRAATQPQRH